MILRHHPHNPKSHIKTQTSSPVTNWQTHSAVLEYSPPGRRPPTDRRAAPHKVQPARGTTERPPATKSQQDRHSDFSKLVFLSYIYLHVLSYMLKMFLQPLTISITSNKTITSLQDNDGTNRHRRPKATKTGTSGHQASENP